jgi:hypothetical protein
MYIVHVDHPTSTVKIHLIGGCGFQRRPLSCTDSGNSEWSYAIASHREAKDYALLSRKKHTRNCAFCERNGGFGA